MRRTIAALALLLLVPNLVPALEILNVRPAYGPHGAARSGTTILPGDLLWIDYAIDGLMVDKNGKANYETKIEFFDSKNMPLFERKTPNEAAPQLGGSQMPGDLHVIVGPELTAGKYAVKLSVMDKIAKTSTSVSYPLEVLPPALGFVRIAAPALGVPGTSYLAEFGLTGMKLGSGAGKKKEPNVEVTIRVLDANEKPVGTSSQIILPRDLPPGEDIEKLQFVPMNYPLFLNRPGQFYLEVVAIDKNAGNRQAKMKLPLKVLDVGAMTGSK